MSYLYDKFKGVFRVVADYDQSTNDFPRSHDGTIDSSFDDFYISSKKNLEVRHGYRNILACFIWSNSTYSSVLNGIGIIENLDIQKNNIETKAKILLDKGILTDYWIGDGEGIIYFKTDQLIKYQNVLQLKRYGANVSPFSTKNLPKSKYKIPANDLKHYHEITSVIPQREIHKISHWNKVFQRNNNIDFTTLRQSCMNFKQYIHKNGLWNDYLNYLSERIHEEL